MKYKLKIENPCEENWNKMTTVDGGKFCSRCCKTVMNFTNLSDGEILKRMKKASHSACIRIREDQHERALIIKESKTSATLTFSKIAASLLLIGASDNANAHTLRNLPFVHVSELSPFKLNKTAKDQKLVNTDNEFFILKGKVLDAKTREVLAFANVIIENSAIGTSTNEQGDFELHIPTCLKGSKLTIVVSYVGYLTQAFEIDTKYDLPKKEVWMELLNTHLSEVVVASKGISREHRSIAGGAISYIEADSVDSKRKSFFKRIPFFRREWWQFWKKRKTDI